MERARKSAVTSGTIEWSVKSDADQPKTLFYVSRYARNGDTIFENRGDQDGWTSFDPQTRQGVSQCQQDAGRTLEQLRPRLTALEQRLEDSRKKNDKKETQRVEVEIEKLREPIDKIFETSLKPRLERLPTRAQRQAATTQPAATPTRP